MRENLLGWKIGNVMPIGASYGFRIKLIFEWGEKIHQKSGFLRKEDAERIRDLTVAEFYNNCYVLDRSISTESFYVDWLEQVKRPLLTNDSYQTYKNCVYNYIIPFMGHVRMAEIKRIHVEALYQKAVERSFSVAKILKTVVTSSMKYAVEQHYISYDPSEDVKLPQGKRDNSYRKKKTTAILNKVQLRHLLSVSRGTSMYLPILFASLMGLRRGEIIGLKYSDVDFQRKTIHIQRQLGKDPAISSDELDPKTITKQEIALKTPNSNRILKLPDLVFQAIMEERALYEQRKRRRKKEFLDLNFICCSSYGRPRSRSYFWAPFKKILQKNNLSDIPWHGLRHTYTTILLRERCSLIAVSRSLGHSKATFTANFYVNESEMIDGICLDVERQQEENENNFSDTVLSDVFIDSLR